METANEPQETARIEGGYANAPASLGADAQPGSRILIAEDDEVIRDLTARALQRVGFVVETACDGEEAWSRLQKQAFDLLVTDNEMPRLKGIQLIERVRAKGLTLPIIVSSASFASQPAVSARLQITAVLPKPVCFSQFLGTVCRVLKAEQE